MNVEELSVLVIEDDEDWLGFCRILLDRTGIRDYDTAKSQHQAVQHFQQRMYDLVISDTMYKDSVPMGPPSVREAHRLGQKPVVVALSSDMDNERLWKEEGLADYFFPKFDFLNAKTTQLGRVLSEKFQIQSQKEK